MRILNEKDNKYLNCIFLQGNTKVIKELISKLNEEVPFCYEEKGRDDFYFMLLCKTYAMYQIMFLKSDELNFKNGYIVHRELSYSPKKFILFIDGDLSKDIEEQLTELKNEFSEEIRVFKSISELAELINKSYHSVVSRKLNN